MSTMTIFLECEDGIDKQQLNSLVDNTEVNNDDYPGTCRLSWNVTIILEREDGIVKQQLNSLGSLN